jgi:hypothetical protein
VQPINAARESELRNRLQATFVDGPRAVGQALAALEIAADRRMGLEPLHLFERREVRVRIIQVRHEADRDQAVTEMIEERAAAHVVRQRPALAVHDQSGLVVFRRHLPEFLDADAVDLRIDTVTQVEPRHQLLRQRAAAAFGEQRVLGVQFHALRIRVFLLAVLADAHVTGRHALHRAVLVEQHFGRREPGEYFDPQLFGTLAEPAADVAEARDVHAVVVHQRGQQPVRNAARLVLRQDQESILLHRRCERSTALLPVRKQFRQRDRVDDRTREDVRTYFGTLLEHADAEFAAGRGGLLFQSNRRRETRRPGPDDDYVELHRFALHEPCPRTAGGGLLVETRIVHRESARDSAAQ